MKHFSYNKGPELRNLETEEIGGKRHYITPSGLKVPSVTTVLSFFKTQSLQEWRDRVGHDEASKISTRATIRGTKFHELMERYLGNEPKIFDESVMPDMKMAFYDCKSTVDRIDNIRYIESPLYSEKLRIAGRTDCIAEFDGVLSIIDFKTSRKIKKPEWITDYFIQGCAYSMMHEELTGVPISQTVIIISVDNEPEPQVFVRENENYRQPLLDKVKSYHEAHRHSAVIAL